MTPPSPARRGEVPALSLRGVSHSYGDHLSVRQVDLTVGGGEIVCLLGPSGCGKTTILRLAAGLETPLAGEIRLGGTLVAEGSRSVPPEERRIGLVFQDIALFPHLDLLDNIAFGLRGSRADLRLRAERWLARVHLSDRVRSWPHMLSGGEQQRVALARALAPEPKLLLMDEPFSSLDPHLRHRMRSETLDLLRQAGVPALIVTHDAEEAMTMADRVIVMRDGELIQDGAPDEIYRRPADLFAARLFGPLNEWHLSVRRGAVRTPLGSLPAPHLVDGQRVVVALRAEGVRAANPATLSEAAERHGLAVRVQQVRPLGADCMVELAGFMPEPPDADRTAGAGSRPGEGQGRRGLAAGSPGTAGHGHESLLMRCRRSEMPSQGESLLLTMDPALSFVFPETLETA